MTDAQLANQPDSEKQNFRATGYILAAVAVYSLTPVLLHVGEAHQSPFMYNAVRTLATCLGLVLFLVIFHYRLLFDINIWRAISNNCMRWSFFGIFIGSFTGAVMGWALKYIDISVATVLYETWPLWVILLTGKMFKGENRYTDVSMFSWVCIFIGFAGLVFVILSQGGNVVLDTSADFFIGILYALVAAVMIALIIGCSIRWGDTVMKEYSSDDKQTDKQTNDRTKLFFAIMGIIVASTPGIVVGVAWSIGDRHNEIVEFDNMTIAFAHGFFVVAVERILFRLANIISTRLEINALAYMTPLFSLAWLGMLGYIDVPRADWLVIGAMGVVSANALLNFKAERRLAYQSLVVALWVCGVVVYFRTFFHAPVFYETVAVVATMFVLILSFRIDRLVRRTSAEDEITLEIWQKISSLP